MSTKRLFYAIDLSDPVLDELEDLQDRFREHVPGGARIRWTPRENIHLTLKFLGSMEADLVGELGDVMDDLVADLDPFSMTVTGLGAFPHPKNPRILWVGADDESSETLATLHRNLESALEPYDVDRDNHAFKAHITYGRVKSSKSPNLNAVESELPAGPFGTTQIEDVALYESELSPSGSEYTVLHRSPLEGGA